MSAKKPIVAQINIVARRFDETLRFYRLVGLEIPEPMNQPPGALHATANTSHGVAFEIDNDFFVRMYSAGHRRGQDNTSVLLGASLGSRAKVDETYARLVAAGHTAYSGPK